jgi:hypothetical protein
LTILAAARTYSGSGPLFDVFEDLGADREDDGVVVM